MPPFRRVEGDRAGPDALGILVPPGRRTVVVVRPRALAWDLVPVRSGGQSASFLEVGRDEAARVAQELQRGLEDRAGGGSGRVEAVAISAGEGYQVRAEVGAFALIACLRVPGRPYKPLEFARAQEAQAAATRLAEVLCPAADADQELYVNNRNFSR
jgi:hypothetical protein